MQRPSQDKVTFVPLSWVKPSLPHWVYSAVAVLPLLGESAPSCCTGGVGGDEGGDESRGDEGGDEEVASAQRVVFGGSKKIPQKYDSVRGSFTYSDNANACPVLCLHALMSPSLAMPNIWIKKKNCGDLMGLW